MLMGSPTMHLGCNFLFYCNGCFANRCYSFLSEIHDGSSWWLELQAKSASRASCIFGRREYVLLTILELVLIFFLNAETGSFS